MRNITENLRKNWKKLIELTFVSILTAVPLTLVFLFFTLPKAEDKIKASKAETTKVAVESVFKVIEYFHGLSVKGDVPEDKAKLMALNVIKALRYHGNEYFWINDSTPKMIMHPIKAELDGKDLSDFKDPNGKKLFVEMVKATDNTTGEGFVDYQWAKPGEEKPVPKISYVKIFKAWGWILGNGVYVDDVQREVALMKKQNLGWFLVASIFATLFSLIMGIRQLKKVIFPIQEAIEVMHIKANELTETTHLLKEASDQLGVNSESQSGSLQQTAAAMTEMNEMIEKTSSSAVTSAKMAEETNLIAKSGQESLKEMIEALQDIQKSNQNLLEAIFNSNKNIESIEGIMEQVSSKTQVINEIVFQTKLLSFNASVEAARAGEHGKGFAVVAEEVGILALRSGESAKEIGNIIEESTTKIKKMSGETQKSVNKILEESKVALENGIKISEKCAESLTKVVDKAQNSSEMSSSILVATQEQSKGSNEISKAMNQLDHSTKTNNAIVDQTRDAANQLTEFSDSLSEIVNSLAQIALEKKKSKEIQNVKEHKKIETDYHENSTEKAA